MSKCIAINIASEKTCITVARRHKKTIVCNTPSEITEAPERARRSVIQILKTHPRQTAIIGIPYTWTFQKLIEKPKGTSRTQLLKYIHHEKNNWSEGMGEPYLYLNKVEKNFLLVTLIPKNTIDALISLIKFSKLKLKIIEITEYTIIHALKPLCDVGAYIYQHTDSCYDFVVFNKKQITFYQKVQHVKELGELNKLIELYNSTEEQAIEKLFLINTVGKTFETNLDTQVIELKQSEALARRILA